MVVDKNIEVMRSRKAVDRPSPDCIKKIFRYDPEKGELIWKINTGKKRLIGSIAGVVRTSGYRRAGLYGKDYYCHHLVWVIHHGKWPSSRIDHSDRNPSNNRVDNLREATQSQNMANSKGRNAESGFKGVHRQMANKYKIWKAVITVNYKSIFLGSFYTPEKAHEAYVRAARKYFGEFSRTS